MRVYFFIAFLLIHKALSQAPNIETLSPINLISKKIQKINGYCYKTSIEFCNEGSDPISGCREEEEIVNRTNILLENAKFSFKSSIFNKHIYEAVPVKKNKKRGLFFFKGTKEKSPIKLFLILKEMPCRASSFQRHHLRNNDNINKENVQTQEPPKHKEAYDLIHRLIDDFPNNQKNR